jgi:transposase
MVELQRTGRSFNELAKEFGCTSWSIRQWVKEADRDGDRGDGGLTSAEREELTRLRRENRRLREEREILSKAAAWFANEKSATSRRSSDSQDLVGWDFAVIRAMVGIGFLRGRAGAAAAELLLPRSGTRRCRKIPGICSSLW